MKIFGSRYRHEPLPGKKIDGLLLRVIFDVGFEGFSDLHPWPQLGDWPLERQIEGLVNGRWSPTVQKSLMFASVDAKARRQNRNLLMGLDWPGTRETKIKMTETTDLSQYASRSRLRLDFNGAWSRAEIENWWMKLPIVIRQKIDVIEDPYDEEGKCTIPTEILYSDWIDNPHWGGKIFKPARDFSIYEQSKRRFKKVMFTHSLDHPLGQASAIWEAATFYKRYPRLKQAGGFGVVKGSAFHEFEQVWSRSSDRLKPTPGLGFGFDSQLRALTWERLL